jgi:serine protease Do
MLKKVICLLLISPVLLSGCASILNGKYQKVNVTTSSNDSKVFVDDEFAGKGKVVVAKLKRDKKIKQLRIETPGYKPENAVAYQTKKSPLYIMSWIPFVVLIYPPLYDSGPKSKNYDKEFSVKPAIKTVSRNEKEKYLTFEKYNRKALEKDKKSKRIEKGNEKIDIPNSIFSDALNKILLENNFLDSTNKVLHRKNNTMFIRASVKKLRMKYVNVNNSQAVNRVIAFPSYWIAEATCEWTLADVYDQTKFSKTIVSESGQFASNYDFSKGEYESSYLSKSVGDALAISFYKLLNDSQARNLLKEDNSKNQSLMPLSILPKSELSNNSLKNARNATVTIVTKSGHGSGCIVSRTGHIVTNYHVVAEAAGKDKKIEVILSTGEKYQANIVRVNDDIDLALLSITDASNLAYFQLPETESFEVGDEVFAIGTPKSLELSQTLSKGIISGLRKLPDNTKLIQTDVSVNSGNSGGSLVGKDGKLYGIVNSKLMGEGVEGIAFCIPAHEIRRALGIE